MRKVVAGREIKGEILHSIDQNVSNYLRYGE